jgi:hypothetical protein
MKKLSLKNLVEKIQSVALRFPFTLFFLLGLSFLFFLEINKQDIDIKPNKWVFFSLGIGLSLIVTLFSEDFKNKLVQIGLNLLAILLLLSYCYFLPDKFLPIHFYQVISIGIVFVLTAFVVPFFKKNNDIPFWEFSKSSILQMFIAFIFAQVLFAGLSLAILSLKELFKIDIQPKLYQDIAVVCYALFATVYFLANITAKSEMHKQEYNFHKFVKILGLYIFLPILALYSLILYVYLAQIVVKWQLPNGWVSTLVSVLGMGGFLSMLILYPLRLENENKVVKLLSKYFPLLLLPLLVLMSVGIFRRLDDYGMTINRLYVLILNIWLYGISLYIFLSRARHLKWIVISFATVLLISSVGPWNIYHITKRSMLKEIGQLLNEAKLLKEGKAIDNSQKTIVLNPKLAESLSEDIKYICNNYGVLNLQPYFSRSIQKETDLDISKSLGIGNIPIKDTYFNAWTEKKTAMMIDLSPYKSMIILPSFNSKKTELLNNSQTKISFNKLDILIKNKTGSAFMISLKPKLKEILQLQKARSSYPLDEMTITTDYCKLIITSVTGNYYSQNDSIHLANCDAQLLLK